MVKLKIGKVDIMQDVAIAAGASFSSVIAGVLPIPIPITGGAEMVIGYAIRAFAPRGILQQVGRGVFIAGLSNLISSFVGGGTLYPVKATAQTQVDGPSVDFGYIHRNPLTVATHTETQVTPSGKQHLPLMPRGIPLSEV